jgi:hypothetical protein
VVIIAKHHHCLTFGPFKGLHFAALPLALVYLYTFNWFYGRIFTSPRFPSPARYLIRAQAFPATPVRAFLSIHFRHHCLRATSCDLDLNFGVA